MIETPQRKTQGKNIEINFVIVDGKLRTWIEQVNLAENVKKNNFGLSNSHAHFVLPKFFSLENGPWAKKYYSHIKNKTL